MRSLFENHRLTDDGLARVRELGGLFDELYNKVCNRTPDSRELDLCGHYMELACFYAKKATAIRPELQEPEQR